MSGFAIRNPYFIVVLCLIVSVLGVSHSGFESINWSKMMA